MLIPKNWDELPEEMQDSIYDALAIMEEGDGIEIDPDHRESSYTRNETLILRVHIPGEQRARRYHVEFFEEDPR